MTTLAVLIGIVKDQLRFRQMASIFKRKIPKATVARALGISAMGFVLVTGFNLLLQITEQAGAPSAPPRSGFLDFFFETVSAFGTVGLSTGVTPSLSFAGKLLVILLMFIGRVGPLTLALAVVVRKRSEPRFEYVEEDIVVG